MYKAKKKFDSSKSLLIITFLLIPFIVSTLKNSGILFAGKGLSNNVDNFLQIIQLKNTLNDGIIIFGFTLLIRILIFLAPIVVVTIIELRDKKFKDTTIGKLKYSKGRKYADIWYFVFQLFGRSFQQIAIFTTLGLTLFYNSVGDFLHNTYLQILPKNDWISSSTLIFLIVYLSNDFLKYCTHRLSHNVPLLWDLHEFHHSATEMTIFNRHRVFQIEDVFTTFIFIPFTVLISSALSESISSGNFIILTFYVFDLFMRDFFGYLGHSSLKITYPKPFNNIYMSPALHWLHHSRDEKHWQCNFGEVYPFWDKLFGTYLDEAHLNEVTHYGIKGGSEYNKHHPLYSYVVVPVLKILRRTNLLRILKNT